MDQNYTKIDLKPQGYIHFLYDSKRLGLPWKQWNVDNKELSNGEIMRQIFLALAFMLSSCLVLGEVPSGRRSAVVVDNRVLATVRDQIITVVDVTKKMDMIFCQQFPQYKGMPEARYEFYRVNWRRIFQELVDRQLISHNG